MTEPLLSQQLESPSGTGRVDPEVRPDSQAPHSTNGIPTSQPPHSHWQFWRSLVPLHQQAPATSPRDRPPKTACSRDRAPDRYGALRRVIELAIGDADVGRYRASLSDVFGLTVRTRTESSGLFANWVMVLIASSNTLLIVAVVA